MGNGTAVDLGVVDSSAGGAQGPGRTTNPGSPGGTAPENPCSASTSITGWCGGRAQDFGDGEAAPAPLPDAPAITISDLASFRPSVGEQGMEPDGWAITGLDANFLGDDATRIVDGALLGQPASVRFAPVSWTWDYGDGDSRTSSTPGATWAQLGLREFDPTSTSHAFDAPGVYTVQLTVSYSAAYSFGGGGWVPVTGSVAAPAAPITVVVGDADTVLVEHPCTVDRDGPGC